MKVVVESPTRLLHPRLTVLVTCVGRDGRSNIIAIAWCMPVSFNPPLVAVSISPRRYSHELIKETREFVVNVPSAEMWRKVLKCGRVSGRAADKWKLAELTPKPAKKVKPPIIEECYAHLECTLEKEIPLGDHTVFVGRVVAAYANEGLFKEGVLDVAKVSPCYHIGEDFFTSLKPTKLQ
ncbi:MAG: flavin reductase family protein [Thermoproteota archaeon]|nr:MAG: flavin reductase family protein [Candidatus Korarchaeota archaeon]